jgi:hypothetical protein
VVGATLFDASLLTPESRFTRGSFFVRISGARRRLPVDKSKADCGVNLLLNIRLPSLIERRIFATSQ